MAYYSHGGAKCPPRLKGWFRKWTRDLLPLQSSLFDRRCNSQVSQHSHLTFSTIKSHLQLCNCEIMILQLQILHYVLFLRRGKESSKMKGWFHVYRSLLRLQSSPSGCRCNFQVVLQSHVLSTIKSSVQLFNREMVVSWTVISPRHSIRRRGKESLELEFAPVFFLRSQV